MNISVLEYEMTLAASRGYCFEASCGFRDLIRILQVSGSPVSLAALVGATVTSPAEGVWLVGCNVGAGRCVLAAAVTSGAALPCPSRTR